MAEGGEAQRALIITNPHSGRGDGPVIAVEAGDTLRDAGWEVEVQVTGAPGEAARIGRERAQSFDVVFSCGGDGTLNEVLTGVVDRDVIVGVIPAGTANDLARAIGLPLDPSEAIAALTPGSSRSIDLLEIDGGEAWSAVAVGVGIDARTVRRAQDNGEEIIGRAAYVAAAAGELGEDILTRLQLEVDGEGWEGDALLVQVANCPNHGGGFEIAPGARIDDGLLDVVLIEAVSRTRALKLIPLIYAGEHLDLPEVRHWSATQVSITQPAEGPVIVDGELAERTSLDIRIAPGRLRLWIPEERSRTRKSRRPEA